MKKKSLLIVTYYFPPGNAVGALRIKSFVEYLKKDFAISVLTRHWAGNEQSWNDYIHDIKGPVKEISDEGVRCIYVESRKNFLYHFFSKLNSLLVLRILRFMYFSFLALLGHIQVQVNAYFSFKKELRKLLKKECFDIVLISNPPQNIIRLIPMVHRWHKGKIVVDYRDLFFNYKLRAEYNPGFYRKMLDHYYDLYQKRYLKYADHIITVVPEFVGELHRIVSKPMSVIYNGYEENNFNKPAPILNTDVFTVSIIGTLYPLQDITFMLSMIEKFIEDKSSREVQFRFIGLSSVREVFNRVKALPKQEFFSYEKRVSSEEAVQEAMKATILYYPAWAGFRGIISTKIFDYMASGVPILIAPGDNNIIDQVVTESGCGTIKHSVTEAVDQLNSYFFEWKKNGKIAYKGSRDYIQRFSRRQQALELKKILENLLSK